MATESPIRILEGKDKWPPPQQSTRYAPSSAKIAIEDFGLFFKGQSFQSLDLDVIPSRSGSAPPSMEGSIAAIESIFSKRKSTLNPGLINPNISTLNRSSLHLHTDITRARGTSVASGQTFGGSLSPLESSHLLTPNVSTVGDWQTTSHIKHTDGSLQLPMNRLRSQEEESVKDLSYGQSSSVSLVETATPDHHNGPLDLAQEDSLHALSLSCDQNRPTSHKSTEEAVLSDSHVPHHYPTSTSTACVNSSSSDDSSISSSHDDTRAAVVEPSQHERDLNAARVELLNNLSISPPEALKIVNASSSSNLDSQNLLQQQAAPEGGNSILFQPSYPQIIYPAISHAYGSSNQFHYVFSDASTTTVQPLLHSPGFTSPLYAAPPLLTPVTPPSPFYPNMHPAGFFPSQYGMGGYTFNPAVLPTYMAGYLPNGAVQLVYGAAAFTTPGVSNGGNVHAFDMQNLQKYYGQRIPLRHGTDPFHLQYIKAGAPVLYGPQTPRHDPKKEAEHVSLNNHRHPQFSAAVYNNSNLRRGNESNHYSYAGGSSPGSAVSPSWRCNTSHPHPPKDGSKSHGLHNRCRNDTNLYSLLEELKTGKGQRFELSDISGYIGELSVDQHGSRFIQERLETCRVEEKVSVFREVIPYATNLMTDVFGNYVIQKLFEYGSPEQRKDLAEQLKGQILPLSLQMYGCRVIQKALEVMDLEQKSRLVKELDGHVTRCVRDQNGNHVIQKCIESIPSDRVHFIISSFRGQVATLSMHPYGCRVIQRVLEHCKDESQTQFIVDEIVDSVSSLAQDQYGNYVTQQVLERSKPRERRTIVEKLAKSIVQLSQCLEYSDSTARDMLIKEIVGHGDKHENLWVMMKDQYANYVIQKIIQKSTSDQRKMLIGLIRNHLTALKKYTYGKHIATRFEELYGEEIQTSDS